MSTVPPIFDRPPMTAPVTVVGDVHLAPEEPGVLRHFLAYVDRVAEAGGTLVLLGDLFDYWYGPPQADDAFTKPILERLAAARDRGLELVFMPGNRDFLFGLGHELGIDVWPDPVRTTWGDRRVVLTHGDLLCTADHAYQKLRRVLRGRGGRPRLWLRNAPSFARRYVAVGLRGVSGRAIKKKPAQWVDIDYGTARQWLEAYDADTIVAGHVHTGVHHRLNGSGKPGEILVLKDWERGGGVVTYGDGSVRLVVPEGADA